VKPNQIGWGCLYSREVYASGVEHAQKCMAPHCGDPMIPVYAIIPEGERPPTNEPDDGDVCRNGSNDYDWNYLCGKTCGYCGNFASEGMAWSFFNELVSSETRYPQPRPDGVQ